MKCIPSDSPMYLLLGTLSPEKRSLVENFLETTWDEDRDLATTALLVFMLADEEALLDTIEQRLAHHGTFSKNALQRYRLFTESAEGQAKQVRNMLKNVHNYRLYPPVPGKISCPPLVMVLGVIACIATLACGYYGDTVGSRRNFDKETCIETHAYQQDLSATARHEGKVQAADFLLHHALETCK